jgi:hypothetical protein
MAGTATIAAMTNLLLEPEPVVATRAVTLVLSEEEWRALFAIEADPVEWLKTTIRERLARRSA